MLEIFIKRRSDTMENNELKVTEELLQNIDAIVDLKLETENLLNEADAVIENCNEILSC
jgi:hypothetical protein